MFGWGCSRGRTVVRVVSVGESAPRSRESTRRRSGGAGVIFLVSVLGFSQAAAALAADQPSPGRMPNDEPVITLELPHPALVVDRLTDPRIQQSLTLLPQYRKFLEGPQFRQLQAVVT